MITEEENGDAARGVGGTDAASITAAAVDYSTHDAGADVGEAAAGEAAEHEPLETVTLTVKFAYFDTLLRSLALIHSLISLALLVAYYHLKVSDSMHSL